MSKLEEYLSEFIVTFFMLIAMVTMSYLAYSALTGINYIEWLNNVPF